MHFGDIVASDILVILLIIINHFYSNFSSNAITSLPAGVFDNVSKLMLLWVHYTALYCSSHKRINCHVSSGIVAPWDA